MSRFFTLRRQLVSYEPPAGTPYVTAPASTEEDSPTRLYTEPIQEFYSGRASGGRIYYSYSGVGALYYEEWFFGTGVTLNGYLNGDGAPFRFTIDDDVEYVGNNQGYSDSAVAIGRVSGLELAFHKLTVYLSGDFSESDRNDFI